MLWKGLLWSCKRATLKISRRTYHHFADIEPRVAEGAVVWIENLEDALSQSLDSSTQSRDLKAVKTVHAWLVKLHMNGHVSLWNKVLNMYGQWPHQRLWRLMFENMPLRDVITFNTIISACARWSSRTTEHLLLYSRMQNEDVKPNHFTLSALLSSTGDFKVHVQIHARAVKSGHNSNRFVGSSLVDCYSKVKWLEGAIRAFDEISDVDLISWNIIIDGCVTNGSRELAIRFFSQMLESGIKYDCFTLTSIIKTCLEPGHLYQGMQIHSSVIKAGLDRETPVGNALVTMYSKCENGMESAYKIFSMIPEPNIISWTAAISGFMQNRLDRDGIEFYQEMVRKGVKENEYSFASILPSCSNLASLEQGRQVHARIVKSEYGRDRMVENALIDMYAKCGSLDDAQRLFSTMHSQDVISLTVMITAFGKHGRGKDAIKIFQQMRKEGFKADGLMLLGVLNACSHSGLVDEGLEVFQLMVVDGIKPTTEQCTCVVDMLGRAGRLKDAENFIWEIGIQSDAAVWQAFLSACKLHGDRDLGEKSAQKILELEPEKEGPYVLLSNIYAERGMWEEKRQVRGRLDYSGLKKETGYSWVGTNCI